jgi:hypothetical protein
MKYILPKLQDILFISFLLGVIIIGPRTLNTDGDLGRHLVLGKYILSSGTIPTTDLFSNTMSGQPLTPHEWLAEIAYSIAYQTFRLYGVVLLEGILIASTLIWVYLDSMERGKSYFAAGIFTAWAAFMTSMHWIARPHLFTFLFLAVWTTGIRKIASGGKYPVWPLPIIMILWANTHGAFIAGFVVWGCYMTGAIWDYFKNRNPEVPASTKKLVVVGLISFFATFINPVGWGLWETSLGYIHNSYLVGHTMEYLSPDFHTVGFVPFMALIAFIIFAFGQAWSRLSVAEGLLLAVWTVMGLYSARNIPLFAIISAPILAWYSQGVAANTKFIKPIDATIRNTDTKLSGFTWPVITLGILLFLALPISNPKINLPDYEFDRTVFPVAATDWLLVNPQQGKMFNYFTWGGYLLYRLWPNQTVFIDGQTDFYGETLTREYEKIISLSPEWETLLEKHNIDWIIVPSNSTMGEEIQNERNWSVIYHDGTAVIARRN